LLQLRLKLLLPMQQLLLLLLRLLWSLQLLLFPLCLQQLLLQLMSALCCVLRVLFSIECIQKRAAKPSAKLLDQAVEAELLLTPDLLAVTAPSSQPALLSMPPVNLILNSQLLLLLLQAAVQAAGPTCDL
jgi:hypothetical protein